MARTRAEVLAAAESKYVVSPVNTILARLVDEPGPLALVGLPHQVFAVRRLQLLGHPSVAAIKCVFGPFFGNELYGSAVDSFLRKFSARKEDVTKLRYRDGEWPGAMTAWLRDGRVLKMPKFHANYLIPFHITDNSLLSHDLTNEFTDLSAGDAWAPDYEQRRQGFSLVVTRTEQGDLVIEEMRREGKLWVREIDEPDAIAMQSHGLDFKKRGGFLRMRRRSRAGLRTVDYGLPPPPITAAPSGVRGYSRRPFRMLLASPGQTRGRFCAERTHRPPLSVVPHAVEGCHARGQKGRPSLGTAQ